jgi:hypothetical protein
MDYQPSPSQEDAEYGYLPAEPLPSPRENGPSSPPPRSHDHEQSNEEAALKHESPKSEQAEEPTKDEEDSNAEEEAKDEEDSKADDADTDGPGDAQQEEREPPEPVEDKEKGADTTPLAKTKARRRAPVNNKENDILESTRNLAEQAPTDSVGIAQTELIAKSTPTTDLEIALAAALKRKETHVQRLTTEILKLKQFISKRKQTYKRKRKDDGAPVRALSGT